MTTCWRSIAHSSTFVACGEAKIRSLFFREHREVPPQREPECTLSKEVEAAEILQRNMQVDNAAEIVGFLESESVDDHIDEDDKSLVDRVRKQVQDEEEDNDAQPDRFAGPDNYERVRCGLCEGSNLREWYHSHYR